MASGPDRSIPVSLPQWMKSKISDRYDLEQTPFSPPNSDDGFFLIKYKKAAPEQEHQHQQQEKPKVITPSFITLDKGLLGNLIQSEPADHTKSCQFMPNSPREIGMRHGVDSSSLTRIKPTGTDDGFKGDNAAYGYSVVAVAHQMIAERSGGEKLVAGPPPISHRIRRNSKSLPASPQTSPKLLRKNPYFTNIIFGSSEVLDENSSILRGSVEELGKWASKINRTFSDNESSTSSSSLSALTTTTTNVAASSSLTTTTGAVATTKTFIGNKTRQQQEFQPIASTSSANMMTSPSLTRQFFAAPPSSPPPPASASASSQVVTLKAKPSHLREMNFWSPTSM